MRNPCDLRRLLRRVFCLLGLILVSILVNCTRRAPDGREIWAEVDGKPITRDQVERYYRSRTAAGSEAASPEQALSFKLNILAELIHNQILASHASRARVTVSEAEVDSKIKELEAPYTPEEFRKKLAEQGLDPASLRDEVRQSLIINKLVNKEIVSRLNITDQEIAEYYERNKGAFSTAETQYHLAQIAVTPLAEAQIRNAKNDDAKNPATAERKVRALYARLQSGEEFAVVAQEYSEDPRTAPGGGDMGFIPASAVESNPILKQAMASLKPGQFSGILRASDGFHIIKLVGREEAGQRPLSDPKVQSSIRQNLTNEREQLLKAAYLEDLRNQVKVVNYLAQKIQGAAANPALIK